MRYFEHLPHAPPDDRQVPDMAFAFYDQMVVFDNVTKTTVVVAMAVQPGAPVHVQVLWARLVQVPEPTVHPPAAAPW